MAEVIHSPKAPDAIGPYVQAQATESLIFTSGQIGIKNGELPADFEEQARNVLENIKAVLEAGGSSLDKVIKSLVFLKNMDDFNKFNALYAEYFAAPCPARSCVEVGRLPKDALVEMEVIAERWHVK